MAIIILCLWSPSPKHRHYHHRCRLDTLISTEASLSSRQLLLLRLLLPLSDKVKQLHGNCISYNKATTIRLLPVGDNFYKTWSSHTITYITSCLDHITSQHALQKQARCPLLCLLQVLRGCYGLKQEPILPTHQKPQHGIEIAFWSWERTLFIQSDSTKVGETDTH